MPVWNRILLLSVMTLGCGPKARVEPPAPAPLTSNSSTPAAPGNAPAGNMALDGKVLYDQYCASCHGGLEQSTAARANAVAIETALQNIPEMQGLPELPDEQVTSLVTALSKVPPGKSRGKP